MKLTRFTNHRPASNSRPRSSQSGQAGTILQIFGRGKDHRRDGEPLQQQPRHHRDGMDVIGKADGRDEQRRAEYRDGDFHFGRAGKSDDR